MATIPPCRDDEREVIGAIVDLIRHAYVAPAGQFEASVVIANPPLEQAPGAG